VAAAGLAHIGRGAWRAGDLASRHGHRYRRPPLRLSRRRAVPRRFSADIVLTGISQAGIPLPDLGVRVWPGTLAIDREPGAIWATEVLTGFLDMLADMSALVDCPATLRLVGAGSEPLPERDQERFRAALSSRVLKAADAGA